MFTLHQVSHTYMRRGQSIGALRNVDLTINDSDFIAVVGPSGSGKTTLLSVLGGMLKPHAGQVFWNQRSLYEMSLTARTGFRNRRLGFVFQTFNLVPWLTAIENVQIPLMLARVPAAQQILRARELLERLDLGNRMHHRPSELSQGQQQRVALARTLANNPEVILADEPTGNLDHDTRIQVMEYLSEFHREGKTIVMVTHDAESAAFAKRTILLVQGVPHEHTKARVA